MKGDMGSTSLAGHRIEGVDIGILQTREISWVNSGKPGLYE